MARTRLLVSDVSGEAIVTPGATEEKKLGPSWEMREPKPPGKGPRPGLV
jgi:hypothetical protein